MHLNSPFRHKWFVVSWSFIGSQVCRNYHKLRVQFENVFPVILSEKGGPITELEFISVELSTIKSFS